MWHKILFLAGLLAMASTNAWSQTCPGPAQRNALLNLERSLVVEGTRAGQTIITDTCGNQRYGQYVEINLTPIAYTPTSTGNPSANYSEFVTDPLGNIWYIDWEGKGKQLTGGGSTCDVDWLQISDNACPDNINDSIYKMKYVSINARYVWPGAKLLVNDSSGTALSVIQGSRNARQAWYDSNGGTFSMYDHGGTAPVWYFPVSANTTWKTTAGTPQTPVGSQVSHFGINAQDSTIQMYQYPNTRSDSNTVLNFLYTDAVGKVRSKPTSSFPLTGLGGIYSGSGTIPDGTEATLSTAGSFVIKNSGVSGNALEIVDNDYCSLVGPSGGTVGVDNTGAASLSGTSGGQVTALGANVLLQPNNGGPVIIGGASTVSPLRFLEPSGSGTNYSSFQAQAQSADITYILPAADGSSGQVLSTNGGGGLAWITAGGGSGTVTSFSAGNLSPLFTTSVATATTTPALTFTASTASANTHYSGPTSGGAATPTFRALVAADLPTGAGGAFVDGGNTFGAAGTLGTNDNFSMQFETRDTVRATLSTTGVFQVSDSQASTNQVLTQCIVSNNTDGTAATGLGVAIGLAAELAGTPDVPQGYISTRWSSVASSGVSEMDFWTKNAGSDAVKMTIEGNGDVGIGTLDPGVRLSNVSTSPTDGTISVTGTGMGWTVGATGGYTAGFYNSSSTTTAHGLLVRSAATDNATRALSIFTGSTPTNALTVACDAKVGILDATPEQPLDVAGTATVVRLIGQDNTPTITVDAAQAGTGASASITSAQSSDLAGRFSITTGTGATAGRWATITFGAAYATTPVVIIGCEDADCAGTGIGRYVNVSTTAFEVFITGSPSSSTTHDFSYHIIGGK